MTLHQDYDEWGVLFENESGDLLMVNPVGMVIWQAVGELSGMETVVTWDGVAYEDVADWMSEEMWEYLMRFVKKGCIVIRVD